MNEKEILRIKSEGIKECAKYLRKTLKAEKKELDALKRERGFCYGDCDIMIRHARIDAFVEQKASLEKYAKKLVYQANEM